MASPEREFPPNSYPVRSSFSPLELLLTRTTKAAALTLLLSVSSVSAQTFDELVTLSQSLKLTTTTLPAGPVTSSVTNSTSLDELAVLPSGRVLSLLRDAELDSWQLVELRPDGTVVPIGEIAKLPLPEGTREFFDSLATLSDGRLFLLRRVSDSAPRLTELDPTTGASLRTVQTSEPVGTLAPAPGGLWTRHDVTRTLHRLDPDSGDVGPAVADVRRLQDIVDADTDSSGRIYFVDTCNACSPTSWEIYSLDPAVGELREESTLESLVPSGSTGLAIRRRCHETATSRCLQGGRFRAEITYRDFLGVSGDAQVAAAQGQDTGIFYFFDKSNWELMVKVLDGCALNGHYWVFTSASTDVEFRLQVTDTQTLSQRTYQNTLGQAAQAIADINAFPCTASFGEQP